MTTQQGLIERIAKELGHKPLAISMWRSRGWVPHPHRFPIAQRAALEGVTLREEDFALTTGKKGGLPHERDPGDYIVET